MNSQQLQMPEMWIKAHHEALKLMSLKPNPFFLFTTEHDNRIEISSDAIINKKRLMIKLET